MTSYAPRPGPRRPGFTPTEILVVAACVGLLLGILQPSLESIAGKSRRAVCLDRLRAIGEASLIYSERDIYNAAIPVHRMQFQQDPDNPIYIGAYEWGGKSGVGRPDWLGESHYLNSRYGTKAGFGPATRPLNEIIYGHKFTDFSDSRVGSMADVELNLDAYRCPADDGPPLGAHCPDWLDNPGRSSYDHYGTSYAANLFMIAFGDREMKSNSPYLRPQSRVPHPARTIYYEENIGRWAWASRRLHEQCSWLGVGVDPGPTKGLRGWHGKDWTYNRAFGDAHAETQTIYIEGYEDSEGYSRHYRIERLSFYPDFGCCQPDDVDCPFTAGGDAESFYCIIVRGDGWQKDTLPAPFICTGVNYTGSERASYDDCVTSE